MSHRIIISSSRAGDAATLHTSEQPAAIDINISYAPSHGDTDKQTLSRVGKLLKLMRKMEDTIVAPETNGEHDE